MKYSSMSRFQCLKYCDINVNDSQVVYFETIHILRALNTILYVPSVFSDNSLIECLLCTQMYPHEKPHACKQTNGDNLIWCILLHSFYLHDKMTKNISTILKSMIFTAIQSLLFCVYSIRMKRYLASFTTSTQCKIRNNVSFEDL